MRASLTIAPRRLLEPVEIGVRTIPAGVHVAACLWLSMRRDDLWPGAAEFRPERWLDDSRATPAPEPESARRSALVVTTSRSGEILVQEPSSSVASASS